MTGRRDAECSHCLRRSQLVMRVDGDCLGQPTTDWLCVSCRMDYPRDQMKNAYFGRLEGRYRLAHARAVPCSFQALQRGIGAEPKALPPDDHLWDDDGADDSVEDDEEAELDMMCGLMPGGQCSQAGSEFCDWTCGRLG